MAKQKSESICNNCNSKTYCMNRSSGMVACNNYNKFPKPSNDEGRR
ncbi:MAG: hypothetical protein IK038_02645 [Bacteroidaceae bacterium]|nr:hypothetical protein [Bacteroidaceae bacterium]